MGITIRFMQVFKKTTMKKILTKISKYLDEVIAWILVLFVLFVLMNPEYLGGKFAGWVNRFLTGFAEAYPCGI